MARAPRANANNGPTVVLSPDPGAIQAGIAVAHDAIGSLGAQPILLVVVLLNMVFAGVAGYFMLQLEQYRAQNPLGSLINLVQSCVLETAPLATLKTATEGHEEEVQRLRGVIDGLRAEQEEQEKAVP